MLAGFLDIATDGTKSVAFALVHEGTLTGPVNFTNIDSEVSVVSFDRDSTGITGGETIFGTILSKVDSDHIDLHPLDFRLNPGEILTITAEAVAGTGHDVTVSHTWAELF